MDASRPRRPTLADVAALAGTSTAVVSYVVNDGPRAVSAVTKERVEQAIAELGYRRNALAGALSAGRADLIGLLVPDSANAFFSELARHLEGAARQRGLLTLLGNTGYSVSAERDYLHTFSDLRPRGIVIATISDSPELAIDCPRVYVHSAPAETASPSVVIDDEDSAAVAVRHLIDHGHTAVHCITGPTDFGPAGRREAGWRRAMRAAGYDTTGLVHPMPFDRLGAEEATTALFNSPSPPSAIFAATDEQAIGVLRAAALCGLRVPEDVAIIGFDGIREALAGSTRLTTVAVPLAELAAVVVDALDGGAPAAHVLHATLSIGETCGSHADDGSPIARPTSG
ncbi:LacI family transcriptional regulator [Microbacterium sp. LTA6]|uniref:LacI family DNA-binding transcriptional regulator n=1 Tax=unclassified Microbacterium TaxID=2609290 RepID=UPI00313A1609